MSATDKLIVAIPCHAGLVSISFDAVGSSIVAPAGLLRDPAVFAAASVILAALQKPEVETIAAADLAAHWAKVAPAPVAGERLSIELKVLPEAMQALKEATVQATAAIKRAKRAKSAQAELVRMIEVFGANGVRV